MLSHVNSVALLGLSFLLLSLQFCTVKTEYNKELFKKLVRNDNSNDDAILLDTQGLLRRSGYDYEVHEVIADDGYITELIRVINPLVERKNLRKPPIAVHHGASIDTTAYVSASSIQHHPEKYPRSYEQDGPITSSNRSLAFVLANNGYDVWLVPTRGSNPENERHTQDENGQNNIYNGDNSGKGMTFGETKDEYERAKNYWLYSLDDIINHELRRQYDKIKEVTGSKELSIFSFSLSAPTTLAFLGSNPEYAKDIVTFVSMGPAMAADHSTTVTKTFFEKLCPKFPTRGIGFVPTYTGQTLTRDIFRTLSKSVAVKYSLIYTAITQLLGPSPKYQANLERTIITHLFKDVSFKSIQQYCQQSVSKKVNKFDYGEKKNLEVYGTPNPPEYKISPLEVKNWIVISGPNDALASPSTVKRLIENVKTRKPVTHIIAPGYNHLDLVAGLEVDKFVNLPLLDILNKNSSS